MSGPTQAQPGAKASKTMSSRLLTMKFMQRAAASPTGSGPSPTSSKSPASGSPSQDPGTPPSAKRSKLSHTPTQEQSDGSYEPVDPSNVRAALASAEATRQAALERSWRGEETRWSFAVRSTDSQATSHGLKVENWQGRLLIDDKEGLETIVFPKTEEGQGRMVFGGKRKHIPSKEKTAGGNDEDEENDEDSDDSDGSEDSEDSFDLEAKEILNSRDEGVSLGKFDETWKPNRISGGIQDLDRIQCHSCGGFGHMMRNCPDKGRKRYQQPIGGRKYG